MKKYILFTLTLIIPFIAFTGCNKEYPDPHSSFAATVTLKPLSDGSFYMETEDTIAIVPTNGIAYPFTGYPEKRALVSFTTDFSTTKSIQGYKRTYDVELGQIDTILTVNPVVSTGSDEEDAKLYGDDAVGLYLTKLFPYIPCSIEDGYLQVSFAYYAYGLAEHKVNLVTGVNPDDPYEVEFRHDVNGDALMHEYSGLVNFPLKELPDTEGKTVDLTVKWRSLVTGDVEKTVFKYCSRSDWPVPNM